MHVREMRRADMPQVGDIAAGAFMEDHLFAYLHPRRHEHPAAYRRYILRRAKGRFVAKGMVSIVCVLDDADFDTDRDAMLAAEKRGEEVVVGYIFLAHNPGKDDKPAALRASVPYAIERWLLDLDRDYKRYFTRLEAATDHGRIDTLLPPGGPDPFAPLEAERKRGKGYWYLASLGVLPKYQRRGIGRRLVRRCQQVASLNDEPIALIASRVGKPMYGKEGFKTVDWINTVGEALDPDAVVLWDPEGKFTVPTEKGEKGSFGLEIELRWKDDVVASA